MPLMQAQVVLPFRSNLPRDIITNTFWFDRDNANTFAADAALVALALTDFYQAAYVLGMAAYVNVGQAHINFYDMSTAPPRVPVRVNIGTPWESTQVTFTTFVPTEVACVLSFQGDPSSGVSQARRRGRIYLGAIGSSSQVISISGTTPFFARWSSALIVDITDAAEVLLADTDGSGGVQWVVYSPTSSSATPVTNGWVDDSPDTQRRRSVDATSRTLWP